MDSEFPDRTGGIASGETVFLKQYGDRRTGTNILYPPGVADAEFPQRRGPDARLGRQAFSFPERTSIVRVEDLWANPKVVLDDLAKGHRLVYRGRGLILIERAAKPAPWDHSPLKERSVSFTTRRKAIHRRLAPVADVIHAAVAEETDWSLFGELGYAPRPGERCWATADSCKEDGVSER